MVPVGNQQIRDGVQLAKVKEARRALTVAKSALQSASRMLHEANLVAAGNAVPSSLSLDKAIAMIDSTPGFRR